MRWENERESSNIEDRRGQSGGGGGLPFSVGGGRLSLGTVAVILIGGWLLGINPLTLLGLLAGGDIGTGQSLAPTTTQSQQVSGQNDAGKRFVSVVLASTEDVWTKIFAANGARYTPPGLVLFSGRTQTACGVGVTGAGPFYCPSDRKIYIDLAFYRVLQDQLGAAGDTAQAYVIAHEVGHHVQNLTGTLQQVEEARRRMDQRSYNALPTIRSRHAAGSMPVTLPKPSMPPQPWATMPSSVAPAAPSTRKASPTAARSSARPGSASATKPARYSAATPSPTGSPDQGRGLPPLAALGTVPVGTAVGVAPAL